MYFRLYNKSRVIQTILPFGRKKFPIGAITMEEKKLPHDHGQNEEKIREHMPGENEIAGVSEALKQLGDPSRFASSGFSATAKNAYSTSLPSSI